MAQKKAAATATAERETQAERDLKAEVAHLREQLAAVEKELRELKGRKKHAFSNEDLHDQI